jgi:hypothetical protein
MTQGMPGAPSGAGLMPLTDVAIGGHNYAQDNTITC